MVETQEDNTGEGSRVNWHVKEHSVVALIEAPALQA